MYREKKSPGWHRGEGYNVKRRKHHSTSDASLPKPPEDRFTGRPVLRRIVERICELQVQAMRLGEGSSDRRELERRIELLDSYTFPHLYEECNKEKRRRVVLQFARNLLALSQYGPEGLGTWNELKKQVDRYQESIGKKPPKRPIRVRYKVTKALEERLAHPSKSWDQIADEFRFGFDAPHRLRMEIFRLRKLLKNEGIEDPTQSVSC